MFTISQSDSKKEHQPLCVSSTRLTLGNMGATVAGWDRLETPDFIRNIWSSIDDMSSLWATSGGDSNDIAGISGLHSSLLERRWGNGMVNYNKYVVEPRLYYGRLEFPDRL